MNVFGGEGVFVVVVVVVEGVPERGGRRMGGSGVGMSSVGDGE